MLLEKSMKKRLNKNFTHEIFMSMDKWEDFMCKGYQKWLKIEIEKINKTSSPNKAIQDTQLSESYRVSKAPVKPASSQ